MATIPRKFKIVIIFRAFSNMGSYVKDAFLKAIPITIGMIGMFFIALSPLYLILKLQLNQTHANELTQLQALPLVQRSTQATQHS